MWDWVIARIRNAIFYRRMRALCKLGHHLWLSEIYGERRCYEGDICIVCGELRINVELLHTK